MLTLILSAFVVVLSEGSQAGPDSTGPILSSDVARAQAWLLSTYPALKRGDLAIRVYGDAQTLRLEVAAQPAVQTPGQQPPPGPVLTVDLHATQDGRVERMSADGPLVQSAARVALAAQVAAHPEWTDADVAAAIAAAGGQYGPASPPTRTPASLATLMRVNATVVRSTFVRSDVRGPIWIVEVATPTRTCYIALEPLGGQVIGIAPK